MRRLTRSSKVAAAARFPIAAAAPLHYPMHIFFTTASPGSLFVSSSFSALLPAAAKLLSNSDRAGGPHNKHTCRSLTTSSTSSNAVSLDQAARASRRKASLSLPGVFRRRSSFFLPFFGRGRSSSLPNGPRSTERRADRRRADRALEGKNERRKGK